MAVQARIQSLQQRHQQLELELDDMLKSPASRHEHIAELKRQKLLLKDEISQLETDRSLH